MTDRIKILFTIPNFDTAGSGKVVYDLVKGLDASKFAPEICCFHDKGSYFDTIKSLNVPIHLFNFTTSYKPYTTLPVRLLKIVRFFRNHQFQIIHSWHWSSDFTEPLAARLAGIPFLYTKKAMGWGNRSWLWRSKLSSKIIGINEDMMRQFFADMKSKAVYMPLGVDTEYYRPMMEDTELRDALSIKDSDFVIISVANLVPVKGIEILLEAVRRLKDHDIKVLLLGSDDHAYGASLKSNFANESVLFLGKQLDVRPYLSISDLFVIPTKNEGRKEGMPIAPLEAMASGRMVLGSKVSGIVDILNPFPNCLFRADAIDELAEKISYFKAMPSENRQELETTMRQHVSSNFSMSDMIIKHELLYTSLVKY